MIGNVTIILFVGKIIVIRVNMDQQMIVVNWVVVKIDLVRKEREIVTRTQSVKETWFVVRIIVMEVCMGQKMIAANME